MFLFVSLSDVVPKKILEIMNVPNLTRENVASHLQVFLLNLYSSYISENLNHALYAYAIFFL